MTDAQRAGVAYFGNRILRHVAADMEGLAADGFTGVLHTYTENDLAYYRQSMGRIVQASHDAGRGRELPHLHPGARRRHR